MLIRLKEDMYVPHHLPDQLKCDLTADWLMKALAIVMKHNIITIAPSSMYLCCWDAPHEVFGYGKVAMTPYPATYAKIQQDLPLEALQADTWFLIFDGQGHYWPAIRASHAPSQSDVHRAGLILDICGSRVITDAGLTRRSVRIQQKT